MSRSHGSIKVINVGRRPSQQSKKSRVTNGRGGLLDNPMRESNEIVRSLLQYGGKFPKTPGMAHSKVPIAPPAMRTLVTYGARVSLTSTSGVASGHVFTGNGAYDPDNTGIGAQPMGFDEWAAFYTRYRVVASGIQVQWIYPGSTNANALWDTVVAPNNGSALAPDLDAAAALPYAKRQVRNVISGGSRGFTPTNSEMSTALLHGINDQAVIAEEDLSATTNTNPAQMWYWQIYAQTADRTTTGTIYAFVQVYYLVDFFERIRNSQSVSEFAGRELSLTLPGKGHTDESDDADLEQFLAWRRKARQLTATTSQ